MYPSRDYKFVCPEGHASFHEIRLVEVDNENVFPSDCPRCGKPRKAYLLERYNA